jgi:hypothetical protein
MIQITTTPARVLTAGAIVVNPTLIIYSRSGTKSLSGRPRMGLIGFLALTGIVGWRLFCLVGESKYRQEKRTPPAPQQEMMLQHFTQVGVAKPVESEQARAARLKLEWSGL